MKLQFQIKRNGNSSKILSSKNLKSIEKLANGATLWKFWTLCATLLMFPLGTVLCYMVLRIRYGPLIKRYKQAICRKLVKLKKKPYRPSAREVRNKVRPAIMKKLHQEDGLSIEAEIVK